MFRSKRSTSLFVLDVTSDTLTRSDLEVIPQEVADAFAAGTTTLVVSVTVGSLSNHLLISSLLFKCKEVAGRFQAHVVVMEKNKDHTDTYESICRHLQIPLYTVGGGSDATLATVVAMHTSPTDPCYDG